jgi:pyrroloquinoline quinone biosynthesis protein D
MTEAVSLSRDDQIEINPMYLFRWEDAQDAYVLLYPEGVVKLNQSAGEILKHISGDTSVGAVVDEISNLYVGDQVADGVQKFLEVSHAKGWIRRKP